MPAAQLRRSMGYVMQSSGLMPHRSVLDNIATVPRLNGVSKAVVRKRAQELLRRRRARFRLGRRYPSQLSGGLNSAWSGPRPRRRPARAAYGRTLQRRGPVVRDELQKELLRLQRDLAKTIVFVTHDIDEATVLGDKVAVFAGGGKLAQYATPEEILRAPANDFVASFVGRDRGFRHLAFSPSDGVAIHPVHTVRADELARRARPGSRRMAARGRRRAPAAGWSAPGAGPATVRADRSSTRGDAPRALDAALSSPSGLGVAVDADGRWPASSRPGKCSP